MHHLILVRAGSPETAGCGCCGAVRRDDVRWGPSTGTSADLDPATARFGELYRTLRETFRDRLEITVLDPRNVVAYVPLVLRDAIRHRVPLRAALRAMGAASFATGVLDGRLVYSGVAPPTEEVVRLVSASLTRGPRDA